VRGQIGIEAHKLHLLG